MSPAAFPGGPDLPILWWASWMVVAFVGYGILGVWYWTGRRNDGSQADRNRSEASDPPSR